MSGRSGRRALIVLLVGAVVLAILFLLPPSNRSLEQRLRDAATPTERAVVANELVGRHGERAERALLAFAATQPLLAYDIERRLLVWYDPGERFFGFAELDQAHPLLGPSGDSDGPFARRTITEQLGMTLPAASGEGVALHALDEPSGDVLFVLETSEGDSFHAARVEGQGYVYVMVTRAEFERRRAGAEASGRG